MARNLQGWHIVVLVVVIVLLFGAKRLPDVAKSVGQSLRIFKREVKDLRHDDARPDVVTPPAGAVAPTAPAAPVPPSSAPAAPPVAGPAPQADQPAPSPVDRPSESGPSATS